jgi:hypothetical protein
MELAAKIWTNDKSIRKQANNAGGRAKSRANKLAHVRAG